MTMNLEQILQYTFTKPELLEQALTHKSFRNENSAQTSGDNERMEFLGDAVLDLALSDVLMSRFPGDQEGALSKKRASLVNEETLAGVARACRVDQLLRLGRGERLTGGVQKPRLLASSLEAVLGAVFIDGGYTAARQAVETLFASHIEELRTSPDFKSDFKTRLQERAQELYKATPTYQVERETGPDHDKQFEVSVRLRDQVLATGQGRSKKAAEQEAAKKALEQMT